MYSSFVETNCIFEIYIHELPWIPIFKAFSHYLAEILAFQYLCHLYHFWRKCQRRILIHEDDCNLALNTIFSLQIMIGSFVNKLLICMYQRCNGPAISWTGPTVIDFFLMVPTARSKAWTCLDRSRPMNRSRP